MNHQAPIGDESTG